ncbi:MAG: hypothetical protein ACYC6N_00845 [Pirellulaceae bacterium]
MLVRVDHRIVTGIDKERDSTNSSTVSTAKHAALDVLDAGIFKMSLDERIEAQACTPEISVSALAACGFGPVGPPVDTTFAEIEEFGHEVGKMVARAVNEKLTNQHAVHFQGTVPCPCCGTVCPVAENPATRDIQTKDGDVPLSEPRCHCPVCNRDFFPSAYRVEN